MFRSFRSLIGFGSKKNSSARKGSKFGKNFRAAFEKLEDRSVPANFTAGNLAILQAMASGSTNSDGRIVEINTTLAGQTPTQVFSIANTGADAYRMSGTATSVGYVSLTADRTEFTFTGANSDLLSGNVNVVNPRAVYTINNSGSTTKETAYTASFTTNAQTRSATTLDGSNWFIVDESGIYTNGGTSPSLAGNFRAAKTFGGTVYLGQRSGTVTNIQVSTISAPSGGTVAGLPGLTNNNNFQDFYFVSSGSNGSTYDVLYITSNTSATVGTITKYSLVSGSWAANGSYSTNFGGFAIAAVDIDPTNSTIGSYLYVTTGTGATSANSVIKLTDTAGYNTAISITTASNVALFTAATGTTLKGLDFAPTASTNSSPIVAAPGTATASTAIGGTVTAFQSSNAFVVTDPDSSNTQTVTVAATAGTVSINNAGVSGVTGNGTGTLTFQGTLANVNTALGTLSYVAPGTVGGGSATISVSSNDGTVGSNTATATVTLTRATPTLTVTRGDTTYDGNPVAASYTLTGISGPAATLDGQSPTLTYYVGIGTGGTNLGSAAPTNAGTYTVAADFAQTANYEAVTSLPVTFVISQKALTVTGITAESKTYDATTAAALSGTAELDGVVAGDFGNVTLVGTPSASFADKIIESGKTVTVTGYSISGSASGNYTLTQPTLLTADITPLAITGSITADDKEEDGTTAATIATRTLSGVIFGDDVTYVGGTANFSQNTPGTGLTVTATGLSLAGLDAGNYTVNTTATTTADITPATGLPQSITFNPLDDKTYGDASFTLSATASSGLTVTFIVASGPATVDGNTLTITGAGTVVVEAQQAGNGTYAPATPVQQSFDVFQKALTATVTGIDKIYDGTVVASVTYDALSGLVGDDEVTAGSGTATFDTKNVGNDKAVTVSGITLSGADAANYVLTSSTATTTADITAKALTASATASNRVYDATTYAGVTLSLTGVVGIEDVTAGFTSASFADKNVGLAKTVTVSGISLSGADIGNYTVNASATTTADISAASLVATATGIDKVYDGTTSATVTISLAGVIGSDDVSGTGVGAFANKNVGTNKPVSVTGIALSGADSPNYTVNTTASTTANITAKALTASVTISNKNFDGTNAALIATRALSGVVGGDTVTISGGTATFDDVSGAIGLNKPVSVTGLTLGGTDAGNYSFDGTTTATGSIGVAIALGDIAFTGYQSATPDKFSFVLLTDIVAGSALTITDNAWTGSALTTNEGVSTISFMTAFSAGTQFNFDASRTAGSRWAVGTDTSNLFDVTTSNFALNGSGDNLFAYTSFAPPTTGGEASWVAAFASNPFLTSGSQNTSLTYLPSAFTLGDTAFSLGIANNAPNENGAYTGPSITDTASTIRTTVFALSNWTTFTANGGQPVPPNATFTVTATSPSTITVTSGDVVYSGTAYVPTVTTTGSTGAVTYSFYLGANTDNPIGSAPVNAGTYSVIAHLASDGTFDAADSPLKTFTITQATATVTIIDYTGVYDGLAHTASVLITGVNGETASNSITGTNVSESGSVTATLANPGNYTNPSGTATLTITQATATVTVIDYTGVYDGLEHTATVLITGVGGSGDILAQNSVSLTNVGTDSASTSISGLQNYLDASGTTTITITPATATVTVIGYTGIYDGLEHTATVLITGVGGSSDILAQNSVSLTNVGTDSASTSISGLQNYLDASGTTTITITPATATVTVIDYTGVYDGLEHTATVLITGVGGSGDILAQNSVSLTNVGTDSASTSISGLQNYLDASGTTTITITPATATVTVIDYTGVYDGLEHTATVLITGVGGSSDILAQNSVSLTNVGTDSASTSISGLQNYLDASGTTTITITPATATVTVIDYTGVYDGLEHTATVLITGVGGSGDILAQNSVSLTNVGTDSASTSISGLQNYLDASGTTTITITPATATVTVIDYTGVYDGLEHTATVLITGVGGSGDILAQNSVSLTNVGTDSASTSISGLQNYLDASGTTTIAITPATATVTVINYTGVYDGLEHTASVTVTGVNGEIANNSLTGTDVASSGTVTATLAIPANYTNPSATATLTITPKALTGSITVADKVEDGTTTGTITSRTLDGVISGDDVTYVGGTANFSQSTPGTGLTVTATGLSLSGADAGNYTVNSIATTTANITPATGLPQSITFNPLDDKTYGDASFVLTATASSGLAVTFIVASGPATIAGSTLTITGAGTVVVEAQQSGNGTYAPATPVQQSFDVFQKSLTATVTGIDKIYDGTVAATVTYDALTGLVGDDVVTAGGGTATFDTKNVGNDKTVTVSGISLSGADAANYVLSSSTATTTADITPKALILTPVDPTKVYDGTTNDVTVTINANGFVPGESATASATGTYSDKNVGTQSVTLSASVFVGSGGFVESNYTFAAPSTATLTITPATATVTVTDYTNVYDGLAHTATVTVTGVNGESASNSITGTNVADSGSASAALSNPANYTGPTSGTASLTITPATATVTIINYNDIYDGLAHTATVTITGVNGETASNSITGTNVADSGSVSATLANPGNYINPSGTATLTIIPATATVTVTDYTNVYDGLAHTATVTITGVNGETASNSVTGTHVADSGFVSAGLANPANYTGPTSGTATLTITPKALTGSITAADKEEDGTTTATITSRTLSGVVAGDDVTYVGGTANFSQSTPGTGLTVTATGLLLDGADAGNYTVNTTATATADITPAADLAQSISFDPLDDKTYGDGSFTLSATASSGLTVTFIVASGPATIVGSTLTITGAGTVVVEAQQAGDDTYAPATPVQQSFDVFQKSLTATVTGIDKIYDGTTVASVNYDALTGLVGDDQVTASGGTATFDIKNVGNDKTVTVSGISLSGTDAANYVLSSSTATTTADITPKALTLTAVDPTKVYDGTTNDVTVTINASGFVPGESATASATGTYSDKNVGSQSMMLSAPVFAGSGGFVESNYTFTAPTNATLTITAKQLTISGVTADDKTYDGTTAATLSGTASLVGVVVGDESDVSLGGTPSASFTDANAGTDKSVTVTGYTISGAASGNYTLAQPIGLTADIARATATVTIIDYNDVYDGLSHTASVVITGVGGAGDILAQNSVSRTNVGTDSATASISGLTNYLDASGTATLILTPATATVTIVNSIDVYDGLAHTATVTVTGVNGETATNSITGTNVAESGSVTATLANPGNYINPSGTATLTITPATATVTIVDYTNVYDGLAHTATVTVAGVNGETASNSITGTNVADSGSVAATLPNPGNYTNPSGTATLTITPATATVTIVDYTDVYDGLAHTATVTITGVNGETASNSITGTNVADSGSVNAALANPANYAGPISGTATLTITPKTLTGSITAADKFFDGTTDATITGRTLSGVIDADDVTYIGGIATFDDASVGNNKTVTATGLSLSGTDAGNYTVNSSATTIASILPNVPTIISIAPFSGPTTGGTTVVITGTGFDYGIDDTTVMFGTNAATIDSIDSSGTTITVTTPAGGAGLVEVVVTTPAGSSSTVGVGNDFTYVSVVAPVFDSMILNGGAMYTIDSYGLSPTGLVGSNSIISQLYVEFNVGVTLDAGAFTIDAGPVSVVIPGGVSPVPVGTDVVTVIAEPQGAPEANGGYKGYRLRFSGSATYLNTIDNSSTGTGGIGNISTTLKDGFYKLNIIGAHVHEGATTAGTPMAGNVEQAFWTLYGSVDPSDRDIAGVDHAGFQGDGSSKISTNASLIGFAATNGSGRTITPPPAYNAVFDWNLDGDIGDDLIEFAKRFGAEWQF